ncbi:MAG: ribonuclease domain-containing protein [Eubacteriales bacterium]|nr:ribonuclease domain-containing protein [Eubacteriales bacterium]
MTGLIKKIKKEKKILITVVLSLFLISLISTACTIVSQPTVKPPSETSLQSKVIKGEYYNSKEDVSLYIHLYGTLPPNYITKQQAQELGWVASKGNLWEVTDRLIIGGDRFGNREKLLPEETGRQYYECDVNYNGGFRGAERLVYSNDGLIFYTSDHYATFKEILFKEGN